MVSIPSASLNAQTVCLFSHRQSLSKLPHQESVWFNLWASSPFSFWSKLGSSYQVFAASWITASPLQLCCCQPDYCNFPEVSSYVTLLKKSNITVLHSSINMPLAALLFSLVIYTTHHNQQGASRSQCWIPADSNHLNTLLWKAAWYKFLYVMMK